MKASRLGLIAMIVATPAFAQSSYMRRGYLRNDGSYVAPSMSTMPNGSRVDNYSSRPNVNPYSGRVGTVDPYAPRGYPNPYAPSPYSPYVKRTKGY